ncbi:MAG: proline--tRNA ligase, partial [Nocardia sp.]|nr:proline--tRNA ligase [Nocardia sp.]
VVSALNAQGLDILFDDRTASPGVKFKDAELLGMPYVLVIGRGWAEGKVELRDRFTGETEDVSADSAVEVVLARIRG